MEQEQRLTAALERVATRDAPGPLDVHVNLVMDAGMDEVVNALVAQPEQHLNRSKAMRLLLDEGAKAILAKRRRATRRVSA